MAASESEDFESADEDVEVNTSLSSVKEIHDHENNDKVNEKSDSSKDAGIDKLNELSEIRVKNSKKDNSNRRLSTDELNKNVKESQVKSNNKTRRHSTACSSSTSKEVKQSGGIKRLGSKLGTKITQSFDVHDKSDKNTYDALSSNKNTEFNSTDNSTTKIESSVQNIVASKDNSTKNNENGECSTKNENSLENKPTQNNVLKKEVENFPVDGWELEDGFEVPSDLSSKPKDEEFEKELFPVLNKLSSLSTSNGKETNKEGNGGGSNWANWGGWGVSSLLSTATESVSTLTSHVSAGFNTVLETRLGAPDPEVLAQTSEKEIQEKEKDKPKDTEELTEDPSGGVAGLGGGFSQLMSGVSQLSTKVISGGLDTLETLGKKTMEVLQEGDPGLRKKRALFFQDDDRPVLSQILREAKDVAEKSDKLEEEKQAARKVHFETLFDDYHGLVHLEALEMLSKQCQLKIHTILLGMSGDTLKDLRETLDQVKELCDLSDEEEEDSDKDYENDTEFAKKVSDAVQIMKVQVPHTKLIEVSESVTRWLVSDIAKSCTPSEIHQKAVSSMAEFTSVSMETFHRMAELLLIKQHHSTADEAESLTQLTGTLCARVSRMATKFTLLLSENDESKKNNAIITTIFMESANSSSYIQDACRLLIPVLQVGAAT
ncbi:protein FAM114A2 [Lycorma delicatula]|uniref:protein FAM114A2 n=1 Tax=Lycorma delicatula TaxID=130591 RepID=UPI003F50DE55